jgi:acetyl coenzyme A synthetase (ADP forming)-like protein
MVSETQGLSPILRPKSIAVIGASRSPATIGYQVLANLVQHGFKGPVYPINPKASAIHSMRAYRSIAEIGEPVDLGVVVVPKQLVPQVISECGEAGVKGVVVISAGFKETGPDGAERERQLLDLVRSYGMRMVGPNCMGVINADPDVSMNATFAPVMPPFGPAGFVSQSGAMGLSVLDYAREYGIGIAQFISVGNKADVSGNDLLLEWENDPSIQTILMYVENFGNPRRFLEIAKRVTRNKPIIALKSGRSIAGARAASSHTGALAASDTTVDALLAQAGVLRAGSVEELFDITMAFGAPQPLPRGRRVAVVTNAGGPGILASDALDAQGLDLVELRPETVQALTPLFPAEASIRNPLDMIASATPSAYRSALDALLADEGVDAVVPIFVPPLGVTQEDVAEAIAGAVRGRTEKTVIPVLMGRKGLPQGRASMHAAGLPAFVFPESAARALSALCRYREWTARPIERPITFETDTDAATAVIEKAQSEGRTKLTEVEALGICHAYGIETAPGELAVDADEAVATATAMGFPVVMKIVSPNIVHKSDSGGVITGLDSADKVQEAYRLILDNVSHAEPDAIVDGVLVQKMVSGGRETICGITRDPLFGPLVMFGLGGIYVEALRDVIFRVAPLSAEDARNMVAGIRGTKLLGVLRGQPAVHTGALENALLRLSQIAVDFPMIEEMDINPLLGFESKAVAVDCRVRLGMITPEGA